MIDLFKYRIITSYLQLTHIIKHRKKLYNFSLVNILLFKIKTRIDISNISRTIVLFNNEKQQKIILIRKI